MAEERQINGPLSTSPTTAAPESSSVDPTASPNITDSSYIHEAKAEEHEDSSIRLERKRDFGLVPIPKSLRYNSEKPAHFGLLMNVVFGLASTFGACSPHTCTYPSKEFNFDL